MKVCCLPHTSTRGTGISRTDNPADNEPVSNAEIKGEGESGERELRK